MRGSIRRPWVVGLCVIGLLVLAGGAWRINRAPSAPIAAASPAQIPNAPVLVETVLVRTKTFVDDVSAVGTLVSNQSVVLHPEVAGRVVKIRFADGGFVKKGTILIELDASVQAAELQQARARLTQANANARRTQDLYARKFVTSSALDQSTAELEVARAGVSLAEAHLAHTRIRAPFDGVVGIRKVAVGDYVKDADALINIEDIATLKLDFRLPEIYLRRLSPGLSVEVTSDVTPGERFAATIEAIDPAVDAQGRSVLLRAKLENSKGHLRPGVFVRVKVFVERRENVIMIPEAAIMPTTNQSQSVFKIEDGYARQATVKTGARRAAEVEVIEGLKSGDQIVVAGQIKLKDGDAVQTKNPPD